MKTVADIIAVLQSFPPDTPVAVLDDIGCGEPEAVLATKRRLLKMGTAGHPPIWDTITLVVITGNSTGEYEAIG